MSVKVSTILSRIDDQMISSGLLTNTRLNAISDIYNQWLLTGEGDENSLSVDLFLNGI